jgi:ribosomal protein L32
MNKVLPAPGDQEHRGMAAEHRIGVGLGGNRRARNRYHEHLSAGNLRACDELPRRVALSRATPSVRLTLSWRRVGQCRSCGAVLVEHRRDPRGSEPTM